MPAGRALRREESGFTLIEVLIVFAIIAIVTAITIPAMAYAIDRSKQMATMSDMRRLGVAVTRYYLDFSRYPGGSVTPAQLRSLLVGYSGQSLVVQDRWLHDFAYSSDQKNSYTIESYGRDGLDGADITYDTRHDFNLDIVYNTSQFIYSPESD